MVVSNFKESQVERLEKLLKLKLKSLGMTQYEVAEAVNEAGVGGLDLAVLECYNLMKRLDLAKKAARNFR